MRRWIGGIAALVLSGCAIGPNYHRPKVEVPAAYRGAESESPSPSSIADVPWWELFHDPVLEQLIEEALTNGYDIRIIAKRVEQARYAVGVTRADLLPQASYQGSAQRGKVFNPFGGDNVTGNNFFAALQMAWEIDVWGRIRRATEASLADLVAAEDVRRGVILSLVTGVSQAYFELREIDLEMEIALRTRDIVSCVRALRERGIRFLDVPSEYYDDARGRLAGVDVAWDEIEELNVLVDRDNDGHLLQIFTETFGDRPTLFFEIIERRGAVGFGEGNFRALFEAIERAQARRGNL